MPSIFCVYIFPMMASMAASGMHTQQMGRCVNLCFCFAVWVVVKDSQMYAGHIFLYNCLPKTLSRLFVYYTHHQELKKSEGTNGS
jgi:hypothetical protein